MNGYRAELNRKETDKCVRICPFCVAKRKPGLTAGLTPERKSVLLFN